jgi:hypothetical protein
LCGVDEPQQRPDFLYLLQRKAQEQKLLGRQSLQHQRANFWRKPTASLDAGLE